jgi:hypothetical protein
MISFLTPYWSGSEMMEIHLRSIRRFYPGAPILVSKRGGGDEEMEGYRRRFGIEYWLDECSYLDAYFRLLQRCGTEYACVIDHDAVLLASLDGLLGGLTGGLYDLVGVEERVREPPGVDWNRLRPAFRGWLRFAPGSAASNFILFNLREFRAKWGLRGVIGKRPKETKDFEFYYGIGQKLSRHKYLLPYHSRRYGFGNLLKDGDTAVVWHQWYGAYRGRLVGSEPGAYEPGVADTYAVVEIGERAFIADYPDLNFSDLTPAWGPDCDVRAEQLAFAATNRFEFPKAAGRAFRALRRWAGYGIRGIASRVATRVGRWWRLR